MRDIKFRGQKVDNGEWVEGYYVKDPSGMHRIYWQPFPEATSNTYHFVIPETVGQFTGLKDKNGADIYEGDFLMYPDETDHEDGMSVIEWDDDNVCFWDRMSGDESQQWKEMRIFGNIHDNKELIK